MSGGRFVAVVAIACCAAAMSACGGGGQGPAKVSVAQWRQRVNAVCRENREETRRIAARVERQHLRANDAAARVIERALPVERRLLGRLRRVETPSALRTDYGTFLNKLENTLPILRQVARNVREGRSDPNLLTREAQLAAETRPFALKHGLLECIPDAR